MLEMLARTEGATLAELAAATDWLPKTIRAALTGLRPHSCDGGLMASVDQQLAELETLSSLQLRTPMLPVRVAG